MQKTEKHALNRNLDCLRKENRNLERHLSRYENPNKSSDSSSMPPSRNKMKDGKLCVFCVFFVVNHQFFFFIDITLVKKILSLQSREIKSQTTVNFISITDQV